MKRILSIALGVVSMISSFVFSQEKLEYTKSMDPLTVAVEHQQKEDYEKALEELNKIYEGDSLFFKYVLTEKMRCHIMLENYEEAKLIGDKYWYFRHKLPTDFYLIYGAALDNLEEFEACQNMYRTILKEYPTNYSIWYNYGASLLLENKYEEAYEAFQKTIMINPRYDRVHIQLANLAFNEKQTTKGLMALGMYLVLSVEKRNNFPQLRYADYMSQTKYWNDDDFEGSSGFDYGGNKSFSSIDQLVHNYLALEKKYKIPSKMQYPFIKQLHLICSQLKDVKFDEDDFWHKTYVSFYRDLLADDEFEGFSYLISTYIENEKMKKKVKKKEKNAVSAYAWSVKSINESFKELDLNFIGYGDVRVERNVNTGHIEYLGEFEVVNDNVTGHIEFFNHEGRKTASGNFKGGDRDGLWKFYHANGRLREVNNFSKGEKVDSAALYLDNGFLSYEVNYENGKINGDVAIYRNGILYRIIPYTDGELGSGVYKQLFPIQTIDYSYNIKDGEQDGDFESLYASGEVYQKGTYKEGDLEGERLTLFRNGEINKKENFVEGKNDGEYISYYINGQVSEEGTYKEGKKIGEWTSYYYSGKKKSTQEFGEDGKETGLETSYTEDGWKLSELIYKKGDIVAYKFFDKDGNILSEDKRKGGDFYFKRYNENGVLITEGTYGKKDANGIWKWYYDNGGIKEKKEFKDGVQIGTYTSYFLNGDVEITYDYNDEGNYHGYFQDYNLNGKFYRQGYLNNGETDGPWRTYYRDGSLQRSSFYIDGEREGFATAYAVNGKPRTSEFYEEGIHMFSIYYDTLGMPFDTIYQVPGERVFEMRYCETCPLYMKVDVMNNKYHGKQVFYFPNEKVASEGAVFNGDRNGEWVGYHPNGQLRYKGTYEYGNKVGTWEYFYKNGKLSKKVPYLNNKIHGERITYEEDGKIKHKSNYYFGRMHGDAYYYMDGKLDHQRVYHYDDFVEYSYTKNGKKVVTPVVNETAEVVVYWNNGKLARKFNMNKGWYEGTYEKYFQNGKPAGEMSYVKNWMDGDYKVYYSNGQLKSVHTYENGLRHGVSNFYYPSGKLKEKRTYVLGKLHGVTESYDEKGNLLQTLYYYNDEIIGME